MLWASKLVEVMFGLNHLRGLISGMFGGWKRNLEIEWDARWMLEGEA